MIVRLAATVARVLLETMIMLLAVALLLGLLGYRIGRRALIDRPDRFSRTGDGIVKLLQLATALRRNSEPDPAVVGEEEE